MWAMWLALGLTVYAFGLVVAVRLAANADRPAAPVYVENHFHGVGTFEQEMAQLLEGMEP